MSNRDKAFNAYFETIATRQSNDSTLDIFYEGWKAAKRDSAIELRVIVEVTDALKELIEKEKAAYEL